MKEVLTSVVRLVERHNHFPKGESDFNLQAFDWSVGDSHVLLLN